MDWATVGTSITSSLAGAGLLSWLLDLFRHRHQVAMDRWDRIQQAYEKQIESLEKRHATEKANQLREEFETQLEAWRAQQGVTALAPRTITVGGLP